MKRIAVVILVAVLAGTGSWFFGVGILPAIVIGLTIGSVGIVLRLATVTSGSREWPPPPPIVTDGARRESSDLSWAIRTRGGGVDSRIIARVRRIAAERLAARQLDIDNPAHRPAIQRLLGPSTTAALVDQNDRAIRFADVVAMLDILDTLARRPATQAELPKTTNSEKKA